MNTPDWLLSYSSDTHSKCGEDGMIKKIFEVIGAESKWCVELGALTGSYGSNTRNLIKNHGWSAVLIEAERTYFEELQRVYTDDKGIVCINTFVSFEGEDSLDNIFKKTLMPKEFDLFSLDIDGADYYLWESLHVYRPRVMVVEFNPTIPHAVNFIQPKDMSVNQGSSLSSLTDLGKNKGYELVAANDDNAFFVLKELFPLFDMDNTSLDLIHLDQSKITYFFQLYDGTIKISGNKKMLWHNKEIDETLIQPLPHKKRYFPNRINPNSRVREIKYVIRSLPFYSFAQKMRKRIFG